MSKSFTYERFDIWDSALRVPASDGAYVMAEDAINREAGLKAEIATLQAQLKDARAFARLARGAALEDAAQIADTTMHYDTTTAQHIAKAIRAKKEPAK